LPLALLLLAHCSSDTTCGGASDLFVELPAGTDAISALDITGACAPLVPTVGGCVPVKATCETSQCDCKLEVQVNATTFGSSTTGICHIRATSKTGAVFAQDLTFTTPAGSCFSVSGPTGVFTVDFGGAGLLDGGAGDAAAGLVDGGDAAAGLVDGGAGDADAGLVDGGVGDAGLVDGGAGDADGAG
jgi:hypothetical protein